MSEPFSDSSAAIDPVLVGADLSIRFDGTAIWDDLGVAIDRGECVAITGPNGTGKSLLLACLAGGIEPTRGTVEVYDKGVGDRRSTARAPGPETVSPAGRVGYLPQEGLLPDALTGREAVAFFRRLDDRITEAWRSNVERLYMIDALDDPIGTYSVGMKRRLELGVVLATDAPVLLLDEPTAGLDPAIAPAVHGLIESRTDEGSAVVFATHRGEDERIADRILSLSDGGLMDPTQESTEGSVR